jgi:hypothetical protein
MEELKRRIKTTCLQRRVRLEEFMKTFDLTKAQFERALDVAGVHLNSEQMAMLCDHYGSRNGLGVDYLIFCDEMDDVFTQKGLEANPTMNITGSLANAQLTEIGDHSMTEVDKMELQDLVAHKSHTL